MGKPETLDFLLVGAGLAGSVLAWEARKRGLRFHVVDQDRGADCSQWAAGICNPITGKRPTRTWLAATLFPYLHDFYAQAQAELGVQLFYPLPIYRPFASIAEQNQGLAETESLAEFVGPNTLDETLAPHLKTGYGGWVTSHGGFVDVPLLLRHVHKTLTLENRLSVQTFDYAQVELLPEGIRWQNHEARYLIFAEGWRLSQNPWFGYLPISPYRGEIIEARLPLPPSQIVVRSGFYAPSPSVSETGLWRIGATYSRELPQPLTTEAGKQELLNKAEALLNTPIVVERHYAGIRPAVRDRRPLLGRHPQHPQLALFNGMGSKGVSQSPWLAAVILDHLFQNTPLPPEADLARFSQPA